MEPTIFKTEELLSIRPYQDDENRQRLFMDALQEELIHHYDNNSMYRLFCQRKGFNPHEGIENLSDIPPVSVSVFKALGHTLNSVPKEDLTLSLQSSATSGIPSTIVIDKLTAKRQGKAMVKVMGEFIGNKRIPFAIMDVDPRVADKKVMGARFAAVTGYMKFASKTVYLLDSDNKGISSFNIQKLLDFITTLEKGEPIVVFGFTYILFQYVLSAIETSKKRIKLPEGSKIIHIGGWKKLESQKISKDYFNERMADAFGISPDDVIDIYGFTEQMGLNYPDCKCGFKHTSSFSDIIVRDPSTHEQLEDGKVGVLEFISPIPHSYPGNIVLTDDMGYVDSKPCPFNRPGRRFKITGRMKKAEVRGCGDILSEKLTFNSNSARPETVDNRLDILHFKGELSSSDSCEQLVEIISYLKQQKKWLEKQPVEALVGIIDAAAKEWLANPELSFLKDKGQLFLSQWCSKTNLYNVARTGLRGNLEYMDAFLPFPDSDKHFLHATGRGLACHWLAGNVQILGMFALVQAIITKNVNLLKVAASDNGVFASIIKSLENVNYTDSNGYTLKGADLAKTIAVVYFDRYSSDLAKKMSLSADIRIAWGGKEAVETVASYPSKINAETVIFGPKLSYAVIARENLDNEQDIKKLARRLAVDVCVFDQAGCASPHHLYIEKGGKISPERFCEILAEAFAKTEIQIPKPQMSPEHASAIHSERGVYDFKGKIWGSPNMSWTILYTEDGDKTFWDNPVYSRTLKVHAVDDIDVSLSVIDSFIQSVGIAAPTERAKKYAEKASDAGVERFPQIGRMLNFEMPWDGMFLIDRLVKWHTLFGPLC